MLLGKTGPSNQLSFECIVQILGDVEDEITNFGGKFGREGGNNVVVLSLLRRYATRV